MHIIMPHILSRTPGNLKRATIVSSVVVLPFVILELVNRRDFHDGFPIVLFGLMWLLSLSFSVTLTPILRSLSAGNRSVPYLRGRWPSIVLLILIAWLWVSLILDQMPCFLGVPNCD